MGDENHVPLLTTDQIRASAGKWTLAGDVGLLGHLTEFSQTILRRAEHVEASISSLCDNVEATCTNFNNVSNQFLSLQNSQFLENRVYEEDTPTEDVHPKLLGNEEVESQQVTVARYKEAAATGLSLLDSHFDRVELVESSDEEDEPSANYPSVVWRPKTIYTQPLPLLIGSAEWWADDNVGLGEFQENDDSERVASASESEGEAPDPGKSVEKRVRLSSSSSSSSSEKVVPTKRPTITQDLSILTQIKEDLFASPSDNLFDNHGGLFEPSGTLFDNDEGADLFGSIQKKPVAIKDKVLNNSSVVPQPPAKMPAVEDGVPTSSEDEVKRKHVMQKLPNDFTKELASKLGVVSKSQDFSSPDTTVGTSKENKSGSKESQQKPYSSGIFDDEDDDDSLFRGGTAAKSSSSSTGLFSDVSKKLPVPKPVSGDDIFGADDDDSSDLFASVPKKVEKTKTVSHDNIDGDKPSGLFDTIRKPVKPEPERTTTTKKEPFVTIPGTSVSSPKNKGLFGHEDDGEDLFRQPFKSSSSASGGLFGKVDLFADDADDDLFGSSKSDEKKKPSQVVTPKPSISHPQDNQAELGLKISTPFGDSPPSFSYSDSQTPSMVDAHNQVFLEAVSESAENSTSDLGRDSSYAKNSPSTWFEPLASSTKKGNDSSGYRTGGHINNTSVYNVRAISPTEQAHGSRKSAPILEEESPSIPNKNRPTSDSISSETSDRSYKPPISKSQSRDSIFKDIVSNDGDDLFSSAVKAETTPPATGITVKKETPKVRKEKPEPSLFGPSPLDDEDLFAKPSGITQPTAAPRKATSRVVSVTVEDDLFATPILEPENPKPIAVPKMGRSTGTHVPLRNEDSDDDLFAPSKPIPNTQKKTETKPPKSTSLFDDDDDSSIFGGPVKVEDTVSISSSRSSLFDDLSVGKSTLPSIFGKEKAAVKTITKNISLFDDVDDDCDLFSQNSQKKKDSLSFSQKPRSAMQADESEKLPPRFSGSSIKESLSERAEPSAGNKSDFFSNVPQVPLFKSPEKSKGQGSTIAHIDDTIQGTASSDNVVKADGKPKAQQTSHDSLIQVDHRSEVQKDFLEEGLREHTITQERLPPPQEMKAKISSKIYSSANLFADHLSDEEGDLFGGQSEAKKSEKLGEPSKVAVGSSVSETNIKKPIPTVPAEDSSPISIKLKPPSSLDVRTSTSLETPTDEKDGEALKTAVPKKIGKLNIPSNLKINPIALMPGAKLVKPAAVLEKVQATEPLEEKIDSADMTVPHKVPDGILKSATRDRAKIQVKRRPQTRKARQEALRHSGIDYDEEPLSPQSESSNAPTILQSADNSPSPVATSSLPSNALSPSTDGEDYFNVPELDVHLEKEDLIFSGRQKEPLLFDGAPILSPAEQHRTSKTDTVSTEVDIKANDLFHSSSPTYDIPRQNVDDDIFSSEEPSQKESSPSPNPLFPKVKPKPSIVVKSFFEDDDDEDVDLFSGAVKSPTAEKSLETVKTIKSEPQSKHFVDPLGLLQDPNN